MVHENTVSINDRMSLITANNFEDPFSFFSQIEKHMPAARPA